MHGFHALVKSKCKIWKLYVFCKFTLTAVQHMSGCLTVYYCDQPLGGSEADWVPPQPLRSVHKDGSYFLPFLSANLRLCVCLLQQRCPVPGGLLQQRASMANRPLLLVASGHLPLLLRHQCTVLPLRLAELHTQVHVRSDPPIPFILT